MTAKSETTTSKKSTATITTRRINQLLEANERLKSELANRNKYEEELRATNFIYSSLVEKGNDVIVIIQDGLLKFVNSTISKITGFKKEEAINKFEEWLYEWLIEKQAWKEPQINGGWENGSLVTAVTNAHKDQNVALHNFEDVNLNIVKEVIKDKVAYYFAVLVSIKEKGFDKYHTQPICCRKEGKYYVLTNGHHRTSSLYVLGNKEIPVTVTSVN